MTDKVSVPTDFWRDRRELDPNGGGVARIRRHLSVDGSVFQAFVFREDLKSYVVVRLE